MYNNEVNPYAYAKKGERAICEKSAKKQERISIIGALHNNKVTATLLFNGSCTRDVFKKFLVACEYHNNY